MTPGGAPRPAREHELRPGDRRLLEQYLSHLRIERGLSPHTLAAYERDLRRYLLELSRQDVDPAAVDPQQLGTWLQALRTGADGGSVLSAASAARSARGWIWVSGKFRKTNRSLSPARCRTSLTSGYACPQDGHS